MRGTLRACAALAIAVLLGGCAGLPQRSELRASVALTNPSDTGLGRHAQALAAGRTPGESGFHLLLRPEAALSARLALIERAERTLDVQYYIFETDVVGAELLAALRRAAARGVRVRLLLDDLQLAGGGPQRQQNFEVRSFNPLPARAGGLTRRVLFSLHEFRRVNHRMHNKLLVADNSFSISGGRNIAIEYFMEAETANFLDLDVLAIGEVVRDQSAGFDRYWNSSQAWPLDLLDGEAPLDALPTPVARDAALPLFAVQSLIWARARVITDDPAKMDGKSLRDRFAQSVSAQTLATIDGAQSRVVIVTPYFIPGSVGLDVMARARARGVETIIVTNSLEATDEPIVHAAYARYRERMLDLGVTLYEVSPTLARRISQWGSLGTSQGRLHAKMAMVDRRWFYIGSMNLDGRSASLNTESGLLIDSPELVDMFLKTVGPERFSGAYEVRLGSDGALQWWEHGRLAHTVEPGRGLRQALLELLVLPFLDEELL